MSVSTAHPLRRFAFTFGSMLGTALLGGCSAPDDADGSPDYDTFAPGAAGSSGASVGQAAGQGGRQATGSAGAAAVGTGPRTQEGAGGNLTASLGQGGSASNVGQTVGGAQNLAGAGSGLGGSGGGGSVGSPGVGRVGAELCGPGPFATPVLTNLVVKPLKFVGDNNFFIWEGPVWTGDVLYFSEIANGNASQINRYTPATDTLERGVFPNAGSNGLALDAQGDLLLAAHDVGGISRLDLPGGTITRGAQQNAGQRFNSPNDLVLRNDGNIYFTDPDFQSPSGRIQGATRVYRIAPPMGAGAISIVEGSFDQPNGVTMSPDGLTLYVTGNGILRSYSLDAAGAPSLAFDFPTGVSGPDGMTVDCAGNIYAVENAARQIRVFSPAGTLLGTIGPTGFGDQGLTNVAFGGPNRTTLYVTAASQDIRGGLYSIELNVPGLPY